MPVNRRRWVVLASVSAILTLCMGMRQSFGLFLQPMTQDLAMSATTFSFAMAVQNLVWGIAGPLVGAFADRYGSRVVLALGGLAYLAGLVAMAESRTSLELLFSGVLIGTAIAATGFGVVMGVVARAVPEARRSAALGAVSALGSGGALIMAPLGQLLIERYDWEITLLSFAAVAGLMLPLAFLVREDAPAGNSARAVKRPQSLAQAVAEARGHSGFLLMTAGFFVCGFQLVFIAIHLPVFLATCHIAPIVGAQALALIGVCNMIGSYGFGLLGGRYRKKHLLAAIYLLRSLAIGVYLLLPISTASTLVFAAAMGFLWLGTAPLTSGLVAQIFGVRYMATLFGFVFLSHQVGSFLGAYLGGVVFDLTGSYDAMWTAAILLGLFAAAVHLPMRDRPVPRLAAAAALAAE